MKVKRKDIGKLIDFLTEQYYNNRNDEEWVDLAGDCIIKDEFVLPEKWAIKAGNKENAEILYPILNSKLKHGWDVNDTSHHKMHLMFEAKSFIKENIVSGNYPIELPKDVTEITLEQFKKYVLNEN